MSSVGAGILLPLGHLPGLPSPAKRLYLETTRVTPAGAFPAPCFTTASKEARCLSRASKNEASGPVGTNVMMADTAGHSETTLPAL